LVNSKQVWNALKRMPKTSKKFIRLLLEDAPGPKLYEEYLAAVAASNAAALSACEFRKQQRMDAALRLAKSKSNRFLTEVFDFIKSKLHDPWKPVALNHTFNEITFVVMFDCPFVQELLKPFMRTSSKVDENELMVAAQAINNEFAFDADFVGFEFPWSNEEDEASASMLVLQAKLLPLFQEAYPDLLSLLPRLNGVVLKAVAEGRLVDAMLQIGEDIYRSKTLGSKLLLDSVDGATAQEVAMADAVWNWAFAKCSKNHPPQLNLLLKTFEHAESNVVVLEKAMDSYLGWIEATTMTDDQVVGFLEHARATLCDSSLFDNLLRGRFDQVRERQRRQPAQL
jgi:hypothetical protein